MGLLLTPGIGWGRPGSGAPGSTRAPVELPPRTVGLRSLGGTFRFDPPGLRISPGETVRWLNIGDFHTVTAFHPDNGSLFPGDIPLRIPEGAGAFHSGMLGLDAGTQFEHRFAQPGVHDYFCQPHYSFGMVGRVIVGDRASADAEPASQLIEAARGELPTVDEVFGRPGEGFEWASRINGVLFLRANAASNLRPLVDGLRSGLSSALEAGLVREARRDGFRSTLDRFVSLAHEGDYERLVQLGDELKDAL